VFGGRLGGQLPRLFLLRDAGEPFPGKLQFELADLAVVEQLLVSQDVDSAPSFVAEPEEWTLIKNRAACS
jgi:hypothetical protein